MSNKSLICFRRAIFVPPILKKNTNLSHETQIVTGKTICRVHI